MYVYKSKTIPRENGKQFPIHPITGGKFGKKREKVTIARNSQNLELMVNLDEFQPLIGKYEVGRIVLNSGEVSEFELKSLLPPAELLEEPKENAKK